MVAYTIKDISNLYGVQQGTVLGWIHRGELRAVNVGKEPNKKIPRWRITEKSLTDFEDLRATKTN